MVKQLYRLFLILFIIIHLNINIHALENIPIDSWIYKDLLKLEACGLIDELGPLNQKPYSRREVALFVFKLINSNNKKFKKNEISKIIRKLNKEFEYELKLLQGSAKPDSDVEKISIRDTELLFLNTKDTTNIYEELGSSNHYVNYPIKDEFTDKDNKKGNNVWINTNLYFDYYNEMGLMYRPLLYWNEDGGKAKTENNEYTISLSYNKFDLIIGKEKIFWGPGQHGSLLLSDNAPPRDMLQIKNTLPVILPWIFDKLGPMKLSAFFSKLDDERLVPDTYFTGMKINFMPFKRFEFGFSKTVFSGGDRVRDGEKYYKPTGLDLFLDLISFIPRELRGKGHEDFSTDTNQIGGFDLRIKIPELNCILYTEYMQEDYRLSLKEYLKTGADDRASLVGLFWNPPFDNYKTDVSAEYATTTEPWYKHGKYSDGYIYKHKIIGHHMGSDADDLWISINRSFDENISFKYSFDFERQGIREGSVITKKYQHSIDMDYIISDNLSTSLSYAAIRYENPDHNKDASIINNFMTGIGLLYRY
ncbi:MAG: hypothetical protein HY934_02100 [Candidatus Firestonebacteria bacterium]|nr:hypothetical protein [Candidatus Firestonebacteria bacterium]